MNACPTPARLGRGLQPLIAALLVGLPSQAADCTPRSLPPFDAAGAGGVGAWRSYRQDVVEDYRLAFGAAPGPMLGVAVMTDTDNTNAKAECLYGPVRLACAATAGK